MEALGTVLAFLMVAPTASDTDVATRSELHEARLYTLEACERELKTLANINLHFWCETSKRKERSQ